MKTLITPSAPVQEVKVFTANLFINSHLFVLEAEWKWDLLSDEIFCSDVIMSADENFTGTRGIFYPEDLQDVKNCIEQLSNKEDQEISFRMITSYGEVKWIQGNHLRLIAETEHNYGDINHNFLLRSFQENELKKNSEKAEQYKTFIDQFERHSNAGSWFLNSSTGECYYSEQMFRLHRIMPSSLNIHPNTFHPFIEPADRPTVVETIDRSFTLKLPVQIEYRIVTPDGKIKQVAYTSEWLHNSKGEVVQYGLLIDKTETNHQIALSDHATNDLHLHQQMLQLHEKTSASGYWYMNLLTKQAFFSDNFYRIHGLKPHTIPASISLFTNYVHANDQEKVQHALHKMRSLQIAPEIEYRIVRPDGKVRFISQKARLIIYGQDELIMSAVIHDITESRNLEKAIITREQELLLKDFISQETEQLAKMGSWTWDLETGKINCSEQMCKLLGYKRKMNLDLKQIIRAIHPDDRKHFTDEINVAIDRKTETGFNFRVVTAGQILHIKGFFKIMNYDARKIMMGTMQDITQEHLMQKQLSETLQISTLLIENIVDAVFITDTNHNVILWNTHSAKLFGKTADEVLGKNFFDSFQKQRNDEWISQFNIALSGEKIEKQEIKIMYKKLHNLFMIPLPGQEKRVVGVLHVLQDVTADKGMRNVLNERLSFIEKLLEQTVDRIIVLDKNLNYKLWNRKAEKHYRINSEYVTGKNILEVFPGLMEHSIYHHLRRALKGETIYLPSVYDEETGTYEETYLVPLTDDKSQVTGVLWIVHDLTKDVMLDEAKAAAEKRLKLVNDDLLMQNRIYGYAEQIAGIGTWSWNIDTNKAVYSDNMFRLFGLEPQAFEPDFINISAFIHPDDKAAVMAAADKLRQGEVHSGMEYRVIRTDGEERIFFNRMQILELDGSRNVIGTTQDITERKSAELKLKTQHNKLIEAQEISHLGSFEYDPIANKLTWSDELYRIYGLEPQSEEMTIGKVISFALDEDRSFLSEKMDLISNSPAKISYSHRITRTDGAIRKINRIIQSHADENGKIRLITGTVHDITDLYESELAKKSAELLVSKKNEFISIAGHELKTPITTLKLSLQLLESGLPDIPEVNNLKPVFQSSLRQINKLNELVNELSEVAVIQSATIELNKSSFNICSLINQSLQDLQPMLEGVDLKITCNQELSVVADRSRLEQVITNLVTNAVKYSTQPKKVDIKVAEDNKVIRFEVADNGIGISVEQQAKVFDRYFRSDLVSGKIAGQGLGLYITREIVQKHGGEIHVESKLNEGSIFTFTIPRS